MAKAAGEKASADIKTEFDAMKTEIKNAQEKLLSLNNESEATLQKAKGIVSSLNTINNTPNNT